MAKGKRVLRLCLLEKLSIIIDEDCTKTILAFDANAKLLNFTEKLKTASGK